MNRICFLFLFVSILCGLSPLRALDPEKTVNHYLHHNWTSRDGLPHDTVYSILQDSQGFMWIGTDSGLVRFDGQEFKVFNKSNTPAIKHNSIITLFMDSRETLWIGTYGGGITMYKNDNFYYPSWMETLPNKLIQSIAEDRENNMWIGTLGGGVVHYSSTDDVLAPVTKEDGLSNNIVSSVLVDGAGKLWIGTADGLDCLEDGEFTRYSVNDGLLDNNIKTLFEDSRGNLWVGTQQGLNKIRNRPGVLARGRFQSITANHGLNDNYIRIIREDKHGSIWVATPKGLNRIRRDNIESFTSTDGLSDDSLLSLFEDNWGNLWLGSSGGGLDALRDGKFMFYTRKDGLSGSHIKAVYHDSGGALWIGTQSSGLNRYKDGKFQTYTEKDGLSSNNIDSLCEDRDGNLWIGTPNGLNRLDRDGVRRFTTEDGLTNSTIKTMFKDSRSQLWIGTFGGGLLQYRDGKFEVYNTQNGLSDNFVTAINEDIHGNLWIGTNNGLNRFKDGQFQVYTTGDKLSDNMITDIYPDRDGVLWIATNGGGLDRFKEDRFMHFNTGLNQFDNTVIYRIMEDSRSNLWMSSNQGLFSVSRHSLNRFGDGKSLTVTPYHFTEQDGLRTSVCSGGFQPAGWMTPQGRMWIPTLQGLAMIDLHRVTLRVEDMPEVFPSRGGKGGTSSPVAVASYVTVTRQQPVVIEKILVDGKPIEAHDNIMLPADTQRIEFFFRVLNYTAPEKVLFKYRLFGKNPEWLDSTGENRVVYRNLSSGKYTFRVLGRNTSGDWIYRGASYTFYVENRFFQSLWFYIIITLVLVAGILIRPRIKAFQRRKEDELIEKYRSSSLSTPQSSTFLDKLNDIMENEKPYLDPNLSLRSLADMVGCTKENLSQVINEHLNVNFKNYINKYRVEIVKEKLADPKENQYVLMKIAFDAGFNSKSVFNAAFKKFTGQSPSQYRKNVQELK